MPKRLGLRPQFVSFGRGLNSTDDPMSLEPGEWPIATRARVHKGAVYKDKGSAQYGADTDATIASDTAQGFGVHAHPTDPRLLIAAGGDIKLDSDGAGTAWTDIVTALDADVDVSFAGQQGVTFIANGIDKTRRFKGGTTTTELPDLPRPEDTPLDYTPRQWYSLIDSMETQANWTESGIVTTDETSIIHNGAKSMKCVSAGSVAGEYCTRDLGSGSEIDLSESDYISFWIRIDTAGELLNFEMSEDNTNWYYVQTLNITEEEVDTWQFVWGDLRTVDPANRNAIRYLRFRTVEATAITFYVDHLTYSGPLAGEYTYGVSFYDSTTGNEGPLGCFRTVKTGDFFNDQVSIPRRTFYIASNAVYMPDGADRVRLYRTMSGGGGFYLIATITPAANAWTYTDIIPDSELTEDIAVQEAPGQSSRAKWLIPHGDRIHHVGGTFVVARSEALYGTIQNASPQTGRVFEVPPLPGESHDFCPLRLAPCLAYAVQFRIDATLTETWTFTVSLIRTARDYTGTTTIATGTTAVVPTADTWYTVTLSPSSYGDLILDDNHSYQISIAYTGVGDLPTFSSAWTSSSPGSKIVFRVLGELPNHVFMSNLGDGGAVPPMVGGEEVAVPTDATGGVYIVGQMDGQKITGWCPHGSDILYGKERRVYIYTGTTMEDYDVQLLLPNIGVKEGCDRTFIDCDGSAVWMAHDRQIYLWNAGDGVTFLSRPIEEFLNELTDAQVADANAVYSERRYWLFLPNAPAGSRCRVYDFDERAWTPGYDNPVWVAMSHGDDLSVSQIYALRSGATYYEVTKLYTTETDECSGIAWLARSRHDPFPDVEKDPRSVKRVRMFRVAHQGTAAETLTVKFYVDRSTTATRTYNLTVPSGTGVKFVEGYPHNDVMGENIAVEVGGTNSNEIGVQYVELHMTRVR